METSKLQRWRLLLGEAADPEGAIDLGSGQLKGMDKALSALYDAEKKGGLGSSAPAVNRWLGDIRQYFPVQVVQLLQRDALDRLGLERMLLEPELLGAIQPDVHLVGTLLQLKQLLPDRTRETARAVVRDVVNALEKKLRFPFEQAVKGALNKSARNLRPTLKEMDWHRTIQLNLKHYQPEHKTIIPEKRIGFGRKSRQLKRVVLLVDQSGSMASSVVYSGIFGSVMASMKSLKTDFIAFDTAVVDLTAQLNDPVDLLFATQLGGGTDIAKALTYANQIIQYPEQTVLVLITDLFEGGDERKMVALMGHLLARGVQLVTLLALSDEGQPSYNHALAGKVTELGVKPMACTPEAFPELMAGMLHQLR